MCLGLIVSHPQSESLAGMSGSGLANNKNNNVGGFKIIIIEGKMTKLLLIILQLLSFRTLRIHSTLKCFF